MDAEEVEPDFFEQGQALNQVRRQSLVEIDRDRTKEKISKMIKIHMAFDCFLGVSYSAYISRAEGSAMTIAMA